MRRHSCVDTIKKQQILKKRIKKAVGAQRIFVLNLWAAKAAQVARGSVRAKAPPSPHARKPGVPGSSPSN